MLIFSRVTRVKQGAEVSTTADDVHTVSGPFALSLLSPFDNTLWSHLHSSPIVAQREPLQAPRKRYCIYGGLGPGGPSSRQFLCFLVASCRILPLSSF